MHSIHPIPALNDNYIWAIVHPESGHCVIVDPGEAKPAHDYLSHNGLILTAIVITHHHWDHTNGTAELVQRYSVPVYGPANDPLDLCDYPLREGDSITLPEVGATFEVLDIPAHTAGHIAYVGCDGVFCGDTLFAAGCGRLFEGTAEQMFSSLGKLAQLPGDTKVYCAHEYTENNLTFAQLVEPENQAVAERLAEVRNIRADHQPSLPSTIELERATNPFLRCHLDSIKMAAEAHAGHSLETSVDVFAEVRRWKDGF